MSKYDYAPAPPGYNTSGTVGTSGTPSGVVYEGPWFVETQSLYVEYVRVPKRSMLATTTLTLSGTAATFNLMSTIIAAKITANYTSYQDNQTYYTSSFAQPQKFTIDAVSADWQGTNYGELTASTMGPVGTVVTNQDHYRRVPWDSTNTAHVQVTKNVTALNYFGVTVSPIEQVMAGQSVATCATVDPQGMVNEYEKWAMEPPIAGSFLYDGVAYPDTQGYDYYINGTFATSKETLWQILSFIDQMGNRVTNQELYAIPAYINSISGLIEGNQGFPEYRISRHDYS